MASEFLAIKNSERLAQLFLRFGLLLPIAVAHALVYPAN
jgi:hypothetical protein